MKLQIPNFHTAKVLVVGDLMLDRYWFGNASRISQEAPVAVVDVDGVEERPGGAANVALNVAALGAHCTLIGVIGDDAAGQVMEAKLRAAGVECHFLVLRDWPTIVKLRLISQQQQLLRMDFEQPLPAAHGRELLRLVRSHVDDATVVVLEDYDKGTLAAPGELVQLARRHGKPVVVDPKFKPFSAYLGADLIKPNRMEFRHAVGQWEDFTEFVTRAAALADRHDIGAMVVTRGSEGMTLVRRDGRHHHVPARQVDVYDETGAGDTVAATLAAALAAGCELEVCTALANLAASIVVSRLGTVAVTQPELQRALSPAQHGDRGILSQAELAAALDAARTNGERIVFTNGCFDILHAGHVAYLEEARRLGDRLIVAVNDDASVGRLKGPGRPVNALAARMRVLSGLTAVDWVVEFEEDTPERLLESLRPDVLVKGGDYAVEDVVGAGIVRGHGGEVRVLGLVDDCSTSAIVERLQRKQPPDLKRR
jgi:D-beta-D-heptose 7-phosphate kinase / D-beta-D-heptose 1-phosphate adenosyltransferase